jgi:O-antigen/teichoic acid export membrane protein
MKDRILNTEIKILNHTFSTKNILLHPLFSGSFFMIFGGNLANFIAYLYHLILGRIMGPSLYGELVATISLIGLIMSIVSFFGIVIVKFVSSAKDEDVPGILDWFKRKTIFVALGISILIWIASPFIGNYVHLSRNISILFAPIFFFTIITFVYKSFLTGVVRFKQVAIVSNVELLGRLFFGLVLVLLGMKVFGAILGMLIAAVCGLLLTRFYLKDVGFSKIKVKGFDWKKVFSYALPVFIVSISFTSLLTIDVVLVKHFFTSHDAGIYGSVSNLGKIIFYGTAPIASVMFPLIAKKKSQKRNYMSIFLLSVLLVFGIGVGILFIYYLFPSIAIKVLYGDKFLEGTKYLILMGIYFILYSVANLFSSFLMSIDRTKPLLVLPFFSLLQIIGIYLFHANFKFIIGVSVLSVSLLLIYLGIYFAYDSKRQKI